MYREQNWRQELRIATPVLKSRPGVFTLFPLHTNLQSVPLPSPCKAAAGFIRAAFPFDIGAPAETTTSITDWVSVIAAAEANGVAPLLYAAIKKSGREDDLLAECIERLRIAYLRSDTANWQALQILQSLLADFDRAAIPVVVLKGGALATTLYPEPALRPMIDLDLLIPRAQIKKADSLLLEQGFVSPVEMSTGFGLELMNYRAYDRGGINPGHIELHWHLFKSPYYCRRVPIQWFWDRTTEITINGERTQVLTQPAQFLHLASHFALHHLADGLIWSYDLALLMAHQAEPVDWDVILNAAERFGLVTSLQLALSRVAETWGVIAPATQVARLERFHSFWRDRAAFSLMLAPRAHARFFLDAVAQPTFFSKVRFCVAHFFPTLEYMRSRYNLKDKRLAPFYYLRRLAEGSWKLFRATVSTIVQR